MTLVSVNEIVEHLNELITESPNRRNLHACYTTETGEHCLIGELATRLGWETPAWGEDTNKKTVAAASTVHEWPLDFEAEMFLAELQRNADQWTVSWAEAYAKTVERFNQ